MGKEESRGEATFTQHDDYIYSLQRRFCAVLVAPTLDGTDGHVWTMTTRCWEPRQVRGVAG